jgi:hypothetical protein
MPCNHCPCHEQTYEIILQFPRASQAAYFLSDLERWTEWKKQNPLPVPEVLPKKKDDDKRGQHTKELHKRTREYQALHPLMSYHECMRLCKNTI